MLFGARVASRGFNDDALGNALDRIHRKGTLKLFTEVSLKAASAYGKTGALPALSVARASGPDACLFPVDQMHVATHGLSPDRPEQPRFVIDDLLRLFEAHDHRIDAAEPEDEA